MAPRRASTRIEKLKQQREEHDKFPSVAPQDELGCKSKESDDEDSKEDHSRSPVEQPQKGKSKKIDEDEWYACSRKFLAPRS